MTRPLAASLFALLLTLGGASSCALFESAGPDNSANESDEGSGLSAAAAVAAEPSVPTRVTVTPSTARIEIGETAQFEAVVYDQFGDVMQTNVR